MKQSQTTIDNAKQSLEVLSESLIELIASKISTQIIIELSKRDKVESLQEKLLTKSELLNRYQISYSTLRKYRSEKGFPFIKIGSTYRYNSKDVDDWLRSR